MNTKLLMGILLGVSMGWMISANAQDKQPASTSKDMSYSERLSQIGDKKTNESLGTISGRDKGEMRKKDLMEAYTHVPNETRTPQEMHEAALRGEFGKEAKKAAEDWAKHGGTFDDEGKMSGTDRMTPKEGHEAALRGEFGEASRKAAEEWAKKGGAVFNEDGSMKMTKGERGDKIVPWHEGGGGLPMPKDLKQGRVVTQGEDSLIYSQHSTATPFTSKEAQAGHEAALRGEYGPAAQKAAAEGMQRSMMSHDSGGGFKGAMESRGMGNMGTMNPSGTNHEQQGTQGWSQSGNMSQMSQGSSPAGGSMSSMMNNSMNNMSMQPMQMTPAQQQMHDAAVRGDYGPEAQKSAQEWQNTQPQPASH